MKTTVILGSANSQGNTRILVDAVFPKSTFTLVDLNLFDISDWDYNARNLEDDFLGIASELAGSSDIIFATPVYWYAMSAQMKRFFDRMSDLITRRKEIGRSLSGRRTWLLSTGSDAELPDGFEIPFHRTSEYFAMTYCGSIYAQLTNDNFHPDLPQKIIAFQQKMLNPKDSFE